MDPTSHSQEASTVTERTQKCLSLMEKERENETANVTILVGETGAGKSSLLEYLTGTHGHSMEAADSVTNEFQLEKTIINSKIYYIMDTPGFDHGSELKVFYEIIRGIEAVRPHARIIGVLLVTPMHHRRVNEMDEKLLRFTREFCGDESMTQVTVVTTFWDAHKEKTKQGYNGRLANILQKVKELWSPRGPISYYQHGRKYEDGQDTGIFLDWDEDRDDIVEYSKDMIHRHYGTINPRDLRIVQELGRGVPLEHTAAGQFLGLTPGSTPNSTPNPASSSSATSRPNDGNTERPKPDTLKQEPPQSSSSSGGTSKKGTDTQTNKKGFWGYVGDFLNTVANNTHIELSAGASGGSSNAGIGFSGGPPGQSLPRMPSGSRYNGPLDPNSLVDTFKAIGLDSSPENRARVGQQLGIAGTPGTAEYNNALRRRIQQFY